MVRKLVAGLEVGKRQLQARALAKAAASAPKEVPLDDNDDLATINTVKSSENLASPAVRARSDPTRAHSPT